MNDYVKDKAIKVIQQFCRDEKAFSALELKLELRNQMPNENITQHAVSKLLQQEYAKNTLWYYNAEQRTSPEGKTYTEYVPDPEYSKPGKTWTVVSPTGSQATQDDISYRELSYRFPYCEILAVVEEKKEQVYEITVRKISEGTIKVKGSSKEEISDNLKFLLERLDESDVKWVSHELMVPFGVENEASDSGPVHYLVDGEWDWYVKTED